MNSARRAKLASLSLSAPALRVVPTLAVLGVEAIVALVRRHWAYPGRRWVSHLLVPEVRVRRHEPVLLAAFGGDFFAGHALLL